MEGYIYVDNGQIHHGRTSILAWFEHRAEEMHRPLPVDEDKNDDEDAHTENT